MDYMNAGDTCQSAGFMKSNNSLCNMSGHLSRISLNLPEIACLGLQVVIKSCRHWVKKFPADYRKLISAKIALNNLATLCGFKSLRDRRVASLFYYTDSTFIDRIVEADTGVNDNYLILNFGTCATHFQVVISGSLHNSPNEQSYTQVLEYDDR